jgi:hypothetical protein
MYDPYASTLTGKREIKDLPVRCSNVERGCEWEGTVGTLEQHVAKCGFTLVPCPNECKEMKKKVKCFMRRDLEEHLRNDCPNRDHSCQYCGKKGTYAKIIGPHDDKCKKKIVPCISDGCTETMERQNIDDHVYTECPHTVISCKYEGIGCTSQLKRKDMPAHEQDDKLHLHMALDTVSVLQDTVSDKCLTVTLNNDNPESITFAVPDYHEVEFTSPSFTSPSFYTNPNGYLMEVAVKTALVEQNLQVYVTTCIRVLKGSHDANLKWPFRGKVKIELLNQLTDRNHFTQTEKVVLREGEQTQCLSIDYPKLDHNRVTNTQYLMDDTLYFRVSVEVESDWPKPCTAK